MYVIGLSLLQYVTPYSYNILDSSLFPHHPLPYFLLITFLILPENAFVLY